MDEDTGKWSKLDWIKSNPLSDADAGSPQLADESVQYQGAAELRLAYRPNPGVTILGVLLIGVMAWGMWHFAATNDRGLVVEGIFHFSPAAATVLYQMIAVVSFIGVVLGLVVGVPRSFMHREIVLDETSIIVPGYGFALKQFRIEFAEITGIRLSKVHRQRFLKLIHTGGSRTLTVSWLAGDGDLETILDWIEARK